MSLEPTGVFNIDKPMGLTSHDVVARVRRLTGVRRVGHAGTLDPLATGVLLVCVGVATRIAEYLQASRKVYLAGVRLGEETDTYDVEGRILRTRPVPALSSQEMQQALQAFCGEIAQTPPPYSAVKLQGRPAYSYARAGVELVLEPRPVTIFEAELVDWQSPNLVVRLSCSPGTYVRSLAHDLGQALACGGHVTALRRLASGAWRVEDAVTLELLAALGGRWEPHLHDIASALVMLPAVVLPEEEAHRFSLGQARPLAAETGELAAIENMADVRVFGPADNLIGIGKIDRRQALLLPHKIFYSPSAFSPSQ